MSKLIRSLISIALVLSLLLTSYVSVFAAAEEVYLSDLRIIYANSYDEAKDILSGTDFKDYKLLNENLNDGTKKIGVWLAYKTTTDIEDAITDLSVMQMDGGYKEGNYEQMIEDSLEEYKKMGEKYETVIEYFNTAYDEGYFLAEIAYRQLNLYTVKTIGIDKKYIPSFEGELLGDIFYDGIDSDKLAEMFMEGNSYVLDNIRSLLSMGVSYNEDGKTYLDKVGDAAAQFDSNPDVYNDDSDKDYDALSALIAPTITTLKEMFKEFSNYEETLNFEDQEISDDELKYAEHKALANMARAVKYLDGKTFYDFCLDYTLNKSDYSSLYPLVAALNEGQKVMTELACYYDVIRYSMSDFPEEFLEGEVEKLEEAYSENPFNIYEGVDRTIFRGTFALTTDAYRTDAYTEKNTLANAYFGGWKNILLNASGIVSGAGGIGFMIWGAFEKKAETAATLATKNEIISKATLTYNDRMAEAVNAMAAKKISNATSLFNGSSPDTLMTNMMKHCFANDKNIDIANMTFFQKYSYFSKKVSEDGLNNVIGSGPEGWTYSQAWYKIEGEVANAEESFAAENAQNISTQIREATTGQIATSTFIFIAGGLMLLYSALSLGSTVINYYFPNYTDIPLSIVDMRETTYGDRYIKYDVVYEAEPREKGYAAGDLNAFEAQRWNALYYTKSYEAGKPLLADEFVASTSNNKAKDGYTPVHRFGEEVCYDLNKYNFSDKSPSIYLSVKQSKNDKSAVADVPQVVGSIFSNGLWLLVGGIGGLVGVGGTIGTQFLLKKRKNKVKSKSEDENT